MILSREPLFIYLTPPVIRLYFCVLAAALLIKGNYNDIERHLMIFCLQETSLGTTRHFPQRSRSPESLQEGPSVRIGGHYILLRRVRPPDSVQLCLVCQKAVSGRYR